MLCLRRLSLLAGLLIAVATTTACSTGSPPPSSSNYGVSSTSSSQSFGGKSGKSYNPVQTFRAPSDRCPTAATAPAATTFEQTGMAIEAVQSDQGWRLESQGATAGEVIAALAQESGEPLLARGHGASVPIYADVRGQPLETVVSWVAAASGMEVIEDADMRLIVDHQRAVELRRAERASQESLRPLETRIIEVDNPSKVGSLASWTHISCRGELISVPSRNWLVVTDEAPTVEAIEELAQWADADEYEPLELEFSTDRRTTYGIPDAQAPVCEVVELEDDIAGSPAAQLIVAAHRRQQQDAVVGCGEGKLAHGSQGNLPPTDQTLRLLELARVQPNVYTSRTMAAWENARQIQSEADAWTLKSFRCDDYAELQQLIATRFDPQVQLLAYAPHSAVLVAAPTSRMEQIQALVDAYQGTDE